ncbi:MAG: TylF/MycF/NovP-related O-methyltransferase [Lentihominibacter sp.]
MKKVVIIGAVAELGVYKGDTAVLLNGLFPDRKLYLFDTFEGFDERDIAAEQQGSDVHPDGRLSYAKAGDFGDTSVEGVLARMPYPDRCIVRKGYFPETAADISDSEFAFVSIDPDLYGPALAGLRFFYERLNPGGAIVLHDYNNLQFEGIKKAVAEFEEELAAAGQPPLKLVPLGDLHGSCVIVK